MSHTKWNNRSEAEKIANSSIPSQEYESEKVQQQQKRAADIRS